MSIISLLIMEIIRFMSNQERPPQLDANHVQQFVLEAHRDLEIVQELYSQEPRLLHARWDWGGGDWESALEAAAHTGQRDIALFLLSEGARISIFVAAMLGELELVKAIIAVQPAAITSTGAHGIPLRLHAQMGGDEARAVLDYLDNLSQQNN
jgi:hypothetical protein